MLKGLALTPPVLGRISIGKVIEKNGKRLPFFICDNLVTILRGIARSHSRDSVALARIARMHIAHRGRD